MKITNSISLDLTISALIIVILISFDIHFKSYKTTAQTQTITDETTSMTIYDDVAVIGMISI